MSAKLIGKLKPLAMNAGGGEAREQFAFFCNVPVARSHKLKTQRASGLESAEPPEEDTRNVARDADLDGVSFVAGDEINHAAIPKKSLAVTLQDVASAMRSMTFGWGMRPLRYRRTDSWLTPILAAN